MNTNKRPHILLGITGSIAAVKGPRLALLLSQQLKAHVKVVLTRTVEEYFWKGVAEGYDGEAWGEFWTVVNGCKESDFVKEDGDWRVKNGSIAVHYASEEWNNYQNLSSPVLHIQLRTWADILLIAPLSAHTLAKFSNGLCDDLLSCIARAWDYGQRNNGSNGKPVVLCPAMNTAMWDHVLTKRQLDVVKGFGNTTENEEIVVVVEPVVKKLACGDVGAGALAELQDIVDCVKSCLGTRYSDLNENFRIKPTDDTSRSKQSNLPQQTLAARKVAMKNAILQYSKQKFAEMQTSHQQQQHTQQSAASSLAAPISPTPNDIITLFLPYLNLGPESLLVDLGCGDGRWLITATKLTKCKCLGIDVDDQRLQIAKQSIEKEALVHKIEIRKQDVFDFVESDCQLFPKVDVFIIYLFRDAMVKIGSLMQKRSGDLRQGVKILCVGFALPKWQPMRVEKSCGLTVYLYENGDAG